MLIVDGSEFSCPSCGQELCQAQVDPPGEQVHHLQPGDNLGVPFTWVWDGREPATRVWLQCLSCHRTCLVQASVYRYPEAPPPAPPSEDIPVVITLDPHKDLPQGFRIGTRDVVIRQIGRFERNLANLPAGHEEADPTGACGDYGVRTDHGRCVLRRSSPVDYSQRAVAGLALWCIPIADRPDAYDRDFECWLMDTEPPRRPTTGPQAPQPVEANLQASAYLLVFQLENALRRFFVAVLQAKHVRPSGDWLKGMLPPEIGASAASRQREESRNTYFPPSLAEDLADYLTLGELRDVVGRRRQDFAPLVPHLDQFLAAMQRLEWARNGIGHCRRLTWSSFGEMKRVVQGLRSAIELGRQELLRSSGGAPPR